ncbi:unnamed protein product [Leptosia nina]|uniref:Uncharacterized protein n=1 Tax=Leptosia nina TaxID=320188 RepID=A0AAV1ISD4_9NEOP
MNAPIAFLICFVAGNAVAYYVQRQLPYNIGPDDPYSVEVSPNFLVEPSQKLFWGNGGSNQVGGNDWWTTITNKFPFLRNKFGRIEAPPQYVPNLSPVYGPPNRVSPQFYAQSVPQFYPAGRDFAITDDAVIITPPDVPAIQPQPVPQPLPEPVPGYRYNKPLNRLELPNH